MPWTDEDLAEIYPEPDGWMIVHHRQPNGNDCYFGPFATKDEAEEWLVDCNGVRREKVGGIIVPLYLTVDWRR